MEEFCGGVFWDINLVWHTSTPDFPLCFQKLVLVLVPDVFLWLLLPFVIRRIRRTSHKNFHIPWTYLNIFKISSTAILLLISIAFLIINAIGYMNSNASTVDVLYPAVEICTYLLVITLELVHKKSCIHSSGILFTYWLLKTVGCIFIFASTMQRVLQPENYVDDMPKFVLTIISVNFVIALMVANGFADTILSPKNILNSCPKKISSPVSVALYSYFDKLAWTGYKRQLENEDLWTLEEIYLCSDAYSEFDALWCKEKQKRRNSPTNILKIVWQMNRWEFFLAVAIKWVADILGFVSPLMLRELINFVSTGIDEPMWKGYVYAIAIYLSTSLASICQNNHFYRTQQIGIRARAAVISAIYRKALKMSNSAKKTSTVGEIVNLMSVDAQRVMDMWQYMGHVTSMPLLVGITLYFLWGLLGPSVLVGVGVIIVMIPVNLVIAGKTSKLQAQLMRHKDYRTKLMNEILSGVKILKLYAWEMPFYELIDRIRNLELISLKKMLILSGITMFLFQFTPFLISVSTFATYVLIDDKHILDATTAFVSLSLFDIMRIPLNFAPMVVAIVVQALVSIKRINKFMATDEVDVDSISHEIIQDKPIIIQDASFSWGGDEEPVLHDISLTIPESTLFAVVGVVGSGKSSLISAILGEMNKKKGTVNTQGSIAYVSQQAWIQNATVRNNILFGKPFNNKKYQKIVEACALTQDFEILSAGDETEIGEKGINLSGGQKQRVSLARAVYNDADIYLLDDPLSAVDAHVGKHIFENVIGPEGLLSNKTRIFVTHGIAYLPYVSSIVVLDEGKILDIGSYQTLLKKGGGFSDFLTTYLKNEDNLDDVEMAELIERQEEILSEIEDEEIKRRLSKRIIRAVSSDEESISGTEKSQLRRRISRLSSRQLSIKEEIVKNENLRQPLGKLTQDEQMEIGKVDMDVYTHYIKSIGLCLFTFCFSILTLAWALSVGSNVWLSIWSSDKPNPDGSQDIGLRNLRLGVYAALGFAQCVFALAASISLTYGSIYASKALHNTMFMSVLRSPMTFFDTTPLGRIVNRFSRDVDVTDYTIPSFLRAIMDSFLQLVGTVVVISLGNALFLVIFAPLMIIYYLIQRLYIDTSRQLKRLESVSRSPIYSLFSETITGLPTLRAFRCEDSFLTKLEDKVDYNHVIYYPTLVAKRWLGIRLEAIGQIVVLAAGIFAVQGRYTMDPGLVGLSVSYSLSITILLTWLIRNWTEFETNIVSVERMKEYMELKSEAPWSVTGLELSSHWPQEGAVNFKKYSTCYREGLDLVLRQISCNISSGEKVGIVGRTGAGKSSLTLALFRLIEGTEGAISIDGIDIGKIGLHDLRSRLTIIPQDPVLFCGSLRMNLDPFEKYSDADIWRALEHSHLKEFITSLAAGLNHEVTEGGENLSVGQRQLVCLARALLRKTKVLVLDEATAAIDLETDDLIQATIRKEFAECTIITIAHRLNTIMDSDRVIVLQNGSIIEFDSPVALIEKVDSVFHSMAKDAGLI